MELRPTPLAAPPPSRPPAITVAGVLLGAALVAVVGGGVLWLSPRSTGTDAQAARDTAIKLEAAGLPELAVEPWQQWLAGGEGTPAERAAVAERLGVALVERGRFEQGLALLYQAEALDESALSADHGAKVVRALEALGRSQAAKSSLAQRTRLDSGPGAKEAVGADDPVVATVDGVAIHRSRIDDALAELPPGAADGFTGAEGRLQLLRQVVGEELLWRKAQRLEIDADPEVRRRVALAERRVVLGSWLEREALKAEPSTSDLETFYAANRERYRPQPHAEPLPLAQVRPLVEQEWRRQRLEGAWRDAVDKELETGKVELFPERLAGGADAP